MPIFFSTEQKGKFPVCGPLCIGPRPIPPKIIFFFPSCDFPMFIQMPFYHVFAVVYFLSFNFNFSFNLSSFVLFFHIF